MFSLEKNEEQVNRYYMRTGYYFDSMVLMNKGISMDLERILKIYTTIKFSRNKFEGEIPRSIGLLKELHVHNFSNNAFTGRIPSSIENLIEFESFNVSQNKLSGEIPQELGNLSYVPYMNFSHNQFVGLVIGGTQFRRKTFSSFEENIGLYGPSLDEVCVDMNAITTQQFEMREPEDHEEYEVISWIAAAIGFIPSIAFGFGLTLGYILVCYNIEWFMSRNKQRSINNHLKSLKR